VWQLPVSTGGDGGDTIGRQIVTVDTRTDTHIHTHKIPELVGPYSEVQYGVNTGMIDEF
jgi:hypothetical protein